MSVRFKLIVSITAVLNAILPTLPSFSQNEGSVDFGPYMAELQQKIKRNWYPPRGQETKKVLVHFKIDSAGTLFSPTIFKSSGSKACDSAALLALSNASPFKPLPAGSPSSVEVEFNFAYNVFNGASAPKANNTAATTSGAKFSSDRGAPLEGEEISLNQQRTEEKPAPAQNPKDMAIKQSRKLYLKAWERIRAKNYQEAKKLLDLAISIHGTAEKYQSRAICFKLIGDKNKWITNYKAAISDYNEAAALYRGSTQIEAADTCAKDSNKLATFIKINTMN